MKEQFKWGILIGLIIIIALISESNASEDYLFILYIITIIASGYIFIRDVLHTYRTYKYEHKIDWLSLTSSIAALAMILLTIQNFI